MIVRQLKPTQFEEIYQELIKKAHSQPLDASYSVDMKINGISYSLKVQPENDNCLVALQAFKIDYDEYGKNFELITRDNLLNALLDNLIYQGIR